jgi:methionine-rich copper-binding protein CopC
MTEERIIAYLLKELPEEELERLEEECFEQERWPVHVNLAEEDLVDAYLRGELAPERRERFEQNYLTTEARRERVRFAAALLRRVDEYNEVPSEADARPTAESTWVDRFLAFWGGPKPALRAAVAVLIAAVILGALWLYLSRGRPPVTFATLTLNASSSNRAEGAQSGKVKLPLGADALRIALTLPAQAPAAARFRVELQNENGETRPLEVAGHSSQTVLVEIPGPQLTRGEYALKLFAVKPDGTEQRIEGSYFFTVE